MIPPPPLGPLRYAATRASPRLSFASLSPLLRPPPLPTALTHRCRLDADGGVLGRAAARPRPVEHAVARSVDLGVPVPKVSPELDVDGMREAARSRKLVLVNYYAPWCPWSRRLQARLH